MLEYFSKEVLEGLNAARLKERARKSRLRVQLGDAVFPILRFWDSGFSMDAARTPHLRGLVDVYDGANHVLQCLIVASVEENGEIIYEFKRSTPVGTGPALDFPRDDDAPIAYLPRN